MKKYIILFLILLFAVSASAQVSPRLDSLAVRALWQMNVPTTFTDLLTQAKVYNAVNLANYQVCVDYNAIPKFDTVYIDSTMEGGALNTDFLRAGDCFLMYKNVARIPVIPITADSLRKIMPTLEQNIREIADSTGVNYFVIHDTTFSIFPKWRMGYDSLLVAVNYFAMDTVLTAAASATSVAPEYRQKIIDYTCKILEEIRGNYGRADYWQKQYGK